MANEEVKYPTTVESAVRLLQGLVPSAEQEKIVRMTVAELAGLHLGLGQWIRNNLGLWGQNMELLEATGERNADDASSAIIRAFWSALRDGLPKVH